MGAHQHRRQVLRGLTGALWLTLVSPLAVALDIPAPPSEQDFPSHNDAKVALGKWLFYDKLLSGNRNIACATCHHALTFLGDGLSLPVGEGGRGLGVARDTGSGLDAIHARVPRNAPQFINGGAYEFVEMFWDGRAMACGTDPACDCDADATNGFCSPAGADLPAGLDSVLAVQAMFPVTSADEMAGQVGENPVADAAAVGNLAGPGGVWEQIADRVRGVPEYVSRFEDAYPDEVMGAGDITMVHIANAVAAYEDVAFRAIDSPFDRFLRGDRRALSYNQQAGMRLFYGEAGCAECHSGTFQTDHGYHAIGMPQIGPGKGDLGPGDDPGQPHGDFGRERVTGDAADRYKFRTPSLRNVALTGPWGHAGGYDTLEAVIRHHLDPVNALDSYDATQLVLPARLDLDAVDLQHHSSADNRGAIAAAVDPNLMPMALSDRTIGLLVDFLHALTDPSSLDLRETVPARVPSGLPLAD